MRFSILEERIYKCFLDSEKNNTNNSQKTQMTIKNLENEIIKNRNLLKPILLELLNNSNEIMNIAEKISDRLFTCYTSKSVKIRNKEMSILTLSKIIMSLCYGLTVLENQELLSEQEYLLFVNEMLKSDINKMYYYLKDEAILAVFFEDYV